MREIIERWHYDNHPDSFRFCSNGLCKEIREYIEPLNPSLVQVANNIDEYVDAGDRPSQDRLQEWSTLMRGALWP